MKQDVSSVGPEFLRQRIEEARKRVVGKTEGLTKGEPADNREPQFSKNLEQDYGAQPQPSSENIPVPGHNGSVLSKKAKSLQIFYDPNRTTSWAPNCRDGWVMIKTTDVRRWLKERGCRSEIKGKESVSEIDSLLTIFQREFDVDYAGSLAGHRRGVYDIEGKRILVKDSPILIEPKAGDCPLIRGIIRNMLGEKQEIYLFGWLKIAHESLRTGKLRVGQALAFAGPRECGKSLLQNHIITPIVGGRSAKPHRYMSGDLPFNGDLFGCEHPIPGTIP